MSGFNERGGIHYGEKNGPRVYFSWPFATLTADAAGLSIRISLGRLWSRTFALERGQIRSIRRKRGTLVSGIVIDHANGECPEYLLFWPFRYPELKERLEALGYRVSER